MDLYFGVIVWIDCYRHDLTQQGNTPAFTDTLVVPCELQVTHVHLDQNQVELSVDTPIEIWYRVVDPNWWMPELLLYVNSTNTCNDWKMLTPGSSEVFLGQRVQDTRVISCESCLRARIFTPATRDQSKFPTEIKSPRK